MIKILAPILVACCVGCAHIEGQGAHIRDLSTRTIACNDKKIPDALVRRVSRLGTEYFIGIELVNSLDLQTVLEEKFETDPNKKGTSQSVDSDKLGELAVEWNKELKIEPGFGLLTAKEIAVLFCETRPIVDRNGRWRVGDYPLEPRTVGDYVTYSGKAEVGERLQRWALFSKIASTTMWAGLAVALVSSELTPVAGTQRYAQGVQTIALASLGFGLVFELSEWRFAANIREFNASIDGAK